MKIQSLIGTQKIDPYRCPSCGHLFEQYTGVPGENRDRPIIAKIEPTKNQLLLMVCERCETGVARNGDAILALTKEQERQLPAHAQAAIDQAAQDRAGDKAHEPSEELMP